MLWNHILEMVYSVVSCAWDSFRYLRIVFYSFLEAVFDLITEAPWFLWPNTPQMLPLCMVNIAQVVQCPTLTNLKSTDYNESKSSMFKVFPHNGLLKDM